MRPAVQTVPVILTSPHSGRHYDAAFLSASRLDAVAIRRSEDSYVDELFGAGPELGMPLLAAEFPRAYCDANREPWELDPAMFADPLPDYVNTTSPRVLAGLGTIARIVETNEAIYRTKISFIEAQARVATCWQPFHSALQGLIAETRARFGICLLVDCHSMPTALGHMRLRPQIVLGDGHGTTCADAVVRFALESLAGTGLEVRVNEPYAGGYITRHYGRPLEGVHCLQIEVARGLYMEERSFRKLANFRPVQDMLRRFLSNLAGAAKALLDYQDLPAAAE